jgi:hypothetical protein
VDRSGQVWSAALPVSSLSPSAGTANCQSSGRITPSNGSFGSHTRSVIDPQFCSLRRLPIDAIEDKMAWFFIAAPIWRLPFRRRAIQMHASAHRRNHHLALCAIAVIASACNSGVPKDSRCRNLVYKDDGLSRSEYLPCAGEIVAALDELRHQSEAAASGDRRARTDGETTLSRVNALINAAGGRNLLELEDRTLRSLNLRISNAVTGYTAFYMVRILEEPDQFAAQTRRAAATELSAATRSHEEALSSSRRLQ